MQTKLNYDFTEKMNLKTRLLIATLLLTLFTSIKAECTEKTYDRDTTLITYLKEFNIHTTTKNELTLLTSGHDKFVDLFKELEKARHHIHLEYFNFRNDSIANTLFEILERKAQEGVEIRAMYDAFGNSSNNQPLKKKHIKSLHEKGIEIVEFDPIKFPWINHVWARDHRKIAIIDGVIGYTGGMNIADYYITGLPKIGEWRDMHIKIKGDAVQDLQKIFLQMWNECTKQDIDGEAYFPYVKDSTFTSAQNKEVAIVDRRPKKTPKTMRRVYAKAIESAQEKVQIINPYFTPTRTIRKAITNAVKKGVIWNDLNYTKELYITKDSTTEAFFKRFDRVKINGQPWEVQAFNDNYGSSSSNKDTGIIRVALKETYTDTDTQIKEMKQEQQTQDAVIIGPDVLSPYDRNIKYVVKNAADGAWKLQLTAAAAGETLNKYISYTIDGDTLVINVETSKSYKKGFDIKYGDITKHITIKSL